MPNIDAWLNAPDYTTYDGLVNRRTVSITVIRAGVALTAQTVRIIIQDSAPSLSDTDSARTGVADIIIIGYKGHASYTDTDIQFGDRFTLEGQMYDVVNVIPGLDSQFQAFGKARS